MLALTATFYFIHGAEYVTGFLWTLNKCTYSSSTSTDTSLSKDSK